MGDDGGRENDRDENGLAMNCVLPKAEGSWCTFALGMVVGMSTAHCIQQVVVLRSHFSRY